MHHRPGLDRVSIAVIFLTGQLIIVATFAAASTTPSPSRSASSTNSRVTMSPTRSPPSTKTSQMTATSAKSHTPPPQCTTFLPPILLQANNTYVIDQGECPGNMTWPEGADNVTIIFEPGAGYFQPECSIVVPSTRDVIFRDFTLTIRHVDWEIPPFQAGGRSLFTNQYRYSGFAIKSSTFLIQDSKISSYIHDPLGFGLTDLETSTTWTMQRVTLISDFTGVGLHQRSWALGWREIYSSDVFILDSSIQYRCTKGTETQGTLRLVAGTAINHAYAVQYSSTVTIRNTLVTTDPSSTCNMAGISKTVSPIMRSASYTIDNSSFKVQAADGRFWTYGLEFDSGFAGGADAVTITNSTFESLGSGVATGVDFGGSSTIGTAVVTLADSTFRTPSPLGRAVQFHAETATSVLTLKNCTVESGSQALSISAAFTGVQEIGIIRLIESNVTAPSLIHFGYPFSSLSGSLVSECSYYNGDVRPLVLEDQNIPSHSSGALDVTSNNSLCIYSGPATPAPVTPAPPTCIQMVDILLNETNTVHTVAHGHCPGSIVVAANQVTIIFEPGAGYFHHTASIFIVGNNVSDLSVVVQKVDWTIGQQYRMFRSQSYGSLIRFKLLIQDSSVNSAIPDPVGLFDWYLDTNSNVTLHNVTLSASDASQSGDYASCLKFAGLRYSSSLTLRNSVLTLTPLGAMSRAYAVWIPLTVTTDSSLTIEETRIEVSMASTQPAYGVYLQELDKSRLKVVDTSIKVSTPTAYVIYLDTPKDLPVILVRNCTLVSDAANTAHGISLRNSAQTGADFQIHDSSINVRGSVGVYGWYSRGFQGMQSRFLLNNSQIFAFHHKNTYTASTSYTGRGVYFLSTIADTEITIQDSTVEAGSKKTWGHAVEFVRSLDSTTNVTIRRSNLTGYGDSGSGGLGGGWSLKFANGVSLGNRLDLERSVFYDDGTSGFISTAPPAFTSFPTHVNSVCSYRNPPSADGHSRHAIDLRMLGAQYSWPSQYQQNIVFEAFITMILNSQLNCTTQTRSQAATVSHGTMTMSETNSHHRHTKTVQNHQPLPAATKSETDSAHHGHTETMQHHKPFPAATPSATARTFTITESEKSESVTGTIRDETLSESESHMPLTLTEPTNTRSLPTGCPSSCDHGDCTQAQGIGHQYWYYCKCHLGPSTGYWVADPDGPCNECKAGYVGSRCDRMLGPTLTHPSSKSVTPPTPAPSAQPNNHPISKTATLTAEGPGETTPAPLTTSAPALTTPTPAPAPTTTTTPAPGEMPTTPAPTPLQKKEFKATLVPGKTKEQLEKKLREMFPNATTTVTTIGKTKNGTEVAFTFDGPNSAAEAKQLEERKAELGTLIDLSTLRASAVDGGNPGGEEEDSTNVALIIGIVVGCLVLLLLIIAVIVRVRSIKTVGRGVHVPDANNAQFLLGDHTEDDLQLGDITKRDAHAQEDNRTLEEMMEQDTRGDLL